MFSTVKLGYNKELYRMFSSEELGDNKGQNTMFSTAKHIQLVTPALMPVTHLNKNYLEMHKNDKRQF